MTDLLTRVRQAKGGDELARLDGEIDVLLNNGDGEQYPARVTSSLDATLALVARARAPCHWGIQSIGAVDTLYEATIDWDWNDETGDVTKTAGETGATPALALLAALLSSLEEG